MKNLIARAALKDLPRLAELLGYLFEQESDFKPVLRKQKAGLKAILRNPKIGCLWVAKRDGHVVVANWLGHGPDHDGTVLVEYDREGRIVWRYGRPHASFVEVIVLDGISKHGLPTAAEQ